MRYYFAVVNNATNKAMGKSKKFDPIRALAVKAVSKNQSVTESYVRLIISGTKKGGSSEDIMREYRKTYDSIKKTIS